MTHVLSCLTHDHDLRLVALALALCLLGSAASLQLFKRIASARGHSRAGWLSLTAIVTGIMTWSTHFVAMMAYRTNMPVELDPVLTLASLLLVIVVAVPGLALATRRQRSDGWVGGGLVGVAIAAMHYLGMKAYRVDAIVNWDARYVVASIALSVLFAGATFDLLRRTGIWRTVAAGGLLSLAVASLHFTGMAAMNVSSGHHAGGGLSALTQIVLAITTAFAGLLVLGCAAVSALIDSSTQNESYRRLRRMALHDGLTDLPNRLSFNEEFGRRLHRKGGYAEMAVVMLDLSRFKAVNDTYGHHVGDQLLIALSARLTALARPGEFIARLGGDEFVALVSYDRETAVTDFLDRLTGTFANAFVFERYAASVSANIGIAVAPRDGCDADGLLAKADLAMYRAKAMHSGVSCFYDAEMDDAVRSQRDLANDLREAVKEGAFELHYQVQASIETGEIVGYEALVRWRHATRGLVPPNDFIPLAEQVGEIIPLSVWILRQACFEAALWTNRHVVSVNLSALHLSEPQLVETVRAALADSGLPPARLMLELTESAIIHDRRFALGQLIALKAMGIAIALDDFGVGYSSLDILRSFPFDRIKLDASFVSEIEGDEQAVSILRSVAALGDTLHMKVLAEGVERAAQLAIVAREGCSSIQGYLIGRPSRQPADAETVRTSMQLAPRAMTNEIATGEIATNEIPKGTAAA